MRIKMLIMCFVCLLALVSCKQIQERNQKEIEDFSALADADCQTVLSKQQKCENSTPSYKAQIACALKYNGLVIVKCNNQNKR